MFRYKLFLKISMFSILTVYVHQAWSFCIHINNDCTEISDNYKIIAKEQTAFVGSTDINNDYRFTLKPRTQGVEKIRLTLQNTQYNQQQEIGKNKSSSKQSLYQMIIIPEKNLTMSETASFHQLLLAKPQRGVLQRRAGLAAVDWKSIQSPFRVKGIPTNLDQVIMPNTKFPDLWITENFIEQQAVYDEGLLFLDGKKHPMCTVGKKTGSIKPCSFIKTVMMVEIPFSPLDKASISIILNDKKKIVQNHEVMMEVRKFIQNEEALSCLVSELIPASPEPLKKQNILNIGAKKKLKHDQLILTSFDKIHENGIPIQGLKEKAEGIVNALPFTKHQRLKPTKKEKKIEALLAKIDKHSSLNHEHPAVLHIFRDLQSILHNLFNADSIPIEDINRYGHPASYVTQSIETALEAVIKVYTRMAYANGIEKPEIIIPQTAHYVLHYLKDQDPFVNILVAPVHLGVNATALSDIDAIEKMITPNTVLIVGSVFNSSYGVSDSIAELSQLAEKYNRQFGIHVDASLGGLSTIWLNSSGIQQQSFGFELPGVSSINLNTKNGIDASTNSNIILFRHQLYKNYITYAVPNTSDGDCFRENPETCGLLPSHFKAWLSLLSNGSDHYKKTFVEMNDLAKDMKKAISAHEELEVIGSPSICFAFRFKKHHELPKSNHELELKAIQYFLKHSEIGLITRLQPLPSLQLCVTEQHTGQPDIKSKFNTILKDAVQFAHAQCFQPSYEVIHTDTKADEALKQFKCEASKKAFMRSVNEVRKLPVNTSLQEAVQFFKTAMMNSIKIMN